MMVMDLKFLIKRLTKEHTLKLQRLLKKTCNMIQGFMTTTKNSFKIIKICISYITVQSHLVALLFAFYPSLVASFSAPGYSRYE